LRTKLIASARLAEFDVHSGANTVMISSRANINNRAMMQSVVKLVLPANVVESSTSQFAIVARSNLGAAVSSIAMLQSGAASHLILRVSTSVVPNIRAVQIVAAIMTARILLAAIARRDPTSGPPLECALVVQAQMQEVLGPFDIAEKISLPVMIALGSNVRVAAHLALTALSASAGCGVYLNRMLAVNTVELTAVVHSAAALVRVSVEDVILEMLAALSIDEDVVHMSGICICGEQFVVTDR
jgi:hypothetical protein